MNKILPKEIKNIYQGHPIAFWGFIAFLALMTWRSIVHLAYQEYGLHQIANFNLISGDPDPMPAIYLFFSLWGLAQLIFCLFCHLCMFKNNDQRLVCKEIFTLSVYYQMYQDIEWGMQIHLNHDLYLLFSLLQ